MGYEILFRKKGGKRWFRSMSHNVGGYKSVGLAKRDLHTGSKYFKDYEEKIRKLKKRKSL